MDAARIALLCLVLRNQGTQQNLPWVGTRTLPFKSTRASPHTGPAAGVRKLTADMAFDVHVVPAQVSCVCQVV